MSSSRSKSSKRSNNNTNNSLAAAPRSHPAEQIPEHRQFLARSLQRNDVELAALADLNRSLHQVKRSIVKHCGEHTLLALGTGELQLSDAGDDCLQLGKGASLDQMPPAQHQVLCIDFLLRRKLRRRLLNRLMRRLHRIAHAMDGNNVEPPGPPRYGDLRLHIDKTAVQQFVQLQQEQDAALQQITRVRQAERAQTAAAAAAAAQVPAVVQDDDKEEDAPPKEEDAMDEDSKGPEETADKETAEENEETAAAGKGDDDEPSPQQDQPEKTPSSPDKTPSSPDNNKQAPAELQQHQPMADPLEACYDALRDYNDAYEKMVDRDTGSVQYTLLENDKDDNHEEDYMAIKFGAGIGAVHRSMSTKEKESEFKRWRTALLSRIPDQPTFAELGMENRVFQLEERRKRALEQAEEKQQDEEKEEEAASPSKKQKGGSPKKLTQEDKTTTAKDDDDDDDDEKMDVEETSEEGDEKHEDAMDVEKDDAEGDEKETSVKDDKEGDKVNAAEQDGQDEMSVDDKDEKDKDAEGGEKETSVDDKNEEKRTEDKEEEPSVDDDVKAEKEKDAEEQGEETPVDDKEESQDADETSMEEKEESQEADETSVEDKEEFEEKANNDGENAKKDAGKEDDNEKKDSKEADDAKNESSADKDHKDEADPLPVHKSISLVAVPSFHDQDLRRIRLIHAELMNTSIQEHARRRLEEVTKEYNRTLGKSNQLCDVLGRVQQDIARVMNSQRPQSNQEYGVQYAVALNAYKKKQRAFNEHKLAKTLPTRLGHHPIGTFVTQNYARRSAEAHQVALAVADLVDAVEGIGRGMIPNEKFKEKFVPPPRSTVDNNAAHRAALQKQYRDLHNQLRINEDERSRAWKKMLKAKTEFQATSHGVRMMTTAQYTTNAPPLRSQIHAMPRQIVRPVMPAYVPVARPRAPVAPRPPAPAPVATVPTATSAFSPGAGVSSGAQHHTSESKYSAARVKQRIAADGTVAPVSEPKKGKDGLYQRPAGRTRKGMQWDAVRGIWVPEPGGGGGGQPGAGGPMP